VTLHHKFLRFLLGLDFFSAIKRINRLEFEIDDLIRKERITMAGLEHLRAAVDNLINEQTNLAAIKQDIDDLKAKVGQGSIITDSDLEALASKIDSVSSGIDTLKAAADLSKV
jgi:prefoldin subunit 5